MAGPKPNLVKRVIDYDILASWALYILILLSAMAASFLCSHPDLRPFVLQKVQLTGRQIGRGSYGSVEEVVIPGAVCAAKKIHDFWRDPAQVPRSAIRKASEQFVKECQFMSTLRHPNIVQFLGVCFLPGSRLPALVMERLLTSLHDLLDPEIDPPPPPNTPKPFFPLNLKVSILHNVASALAYLHKQSPPVIHRDLSARNVLLNSGMVAKIADLGVARIVPHMRREQLAATMTKGPGAIVYMPPEALESKTEDDAEEDTKSRYGLGIDIFSFGVVAIFALSQTFPCNMQAATYRKGSRLLARTELERREKYMAVLYKDLRKKHPLLQMIEGCLDFPEKRPVIDQILGFLAEARAEVRRDRQTEMNKLELVQNLHTQSLIKRQLDFHVQGLQQQLQNKIQENADKVEELASKENDLIRAQATIRRARQIILTKEEDLAKAYQELKEKEEELQSSEALVADMQKALRQKDLLKIVQSKLTLQCHQKKATPYNMSRGSATTDGQFVYFSPLASSSLYQYDYTKDKWEKLQACLYHDSGLAIINNELTSIGGWDGSGRTSKLMTLQKGVWVEQYPPMKTARYSPAVVTTADGNLLFVIGGYVGDHNRSSTVELYQVRSRMCYLITDLPEPLYYPSATICGTQLYVLGDDNGYTCSLQSLPFGNQSLTSPLSLTWIPLPPLPLRYSTVATLCGQLVLVCGRQFSSDVGFIYQLVYEHWTEIGVMDTCMSDCLVVSPALDRILIFGGKNVEEAVFKL